MALLGMQADMQCKSYFPGHYSTVDLNLDTSGSIWPPYNVDTVMKSEQYCNGTLSHSSPNQHWMYNKEVLKQTMLKHQATFRDQIHELHRLYWRQRELMDEMKRNKLQNHHLNLDTLQSNPHLSQKSCDFSQKQCHILSLPGVNPACNQLFVSTAENSVLLSNFNEGKSTDAGLDPAETKFSLKDGQFESKCKKFGKQILNLERPAYEFIDSDEEESIEKVPEVSGYPQGKVSEVVHMSNQQSYHENAGFNSVLQKDYSTPDTVSLKKNYLTDLNEPLKFEKEADPMSTYLVDLNEPINLEDEATPMLKFLVDLNEPIKLQEEVASRSKDFPSLSTGHRKLPYQDLSQKSNSGLQVLALDVIQNTKLRRDLETCSNGLQPEKNKMLEWPSYDDEAGQSSSKVASLSSGFSEEVSKSFEDVDLKQAHELPSSFVMDRSKKTFDSEGVESLGRELSPNSYPQRASCQLLSLTDVGNSKASLVSNWRKHTHDFVRTPIAVQALPCFNSAVPLSKSLSPITSSGLTGKKSHYSKNLKSCPNFDGTKFHQHSYGSNSESETSESPPPSINCNGMDCSNSDDLTSEQHGPVEIVKPSMDVKPANDKNFSSMSQSCSSDGEKKIEDSTEGLTWLKTKSVCKEIRGKRSESSTQVESVLLQANSACVFDFELKKVEASNNSSSKMLLGGEQLTSDKLVAGDGLDKNISGFGIGIDLNSFIDEHESSPIPSLFATIDLEAPASPENKERSPPRGESEEIAGFHHTQAPTVTFSLKNKQVTDQTLRRFIFKKQLYIYTYIYISLVSVSLDLKTLPLFSKTLQINQNQNQKHAHFEFFKTRSLLMMMMKTRFVVVLAFFVLLLSDFGNVLAYSNNAPAPSPTTSSSTAAKPPSPAKTPASPQASPSKTPAKSPVSSPPTVSPSMSSPVATPVQPPVQSPPPPTASPPVQSPASLPPSVPSPPATPASSPVSAPVGAPPTAEGPVITAAPETPVSVPSSSATPADSPVVFPSNSSPPSPGPGSLAPAAAAGPGSVSDESGSGSMFEVRVILSGLAIGAALAF